MQILRKFKKNQDQQTNATTNNPTLASGTAVPEFTMPATNDRMIQRADLIGRPTILAFYPADNSPVCSNQMALYNEVLPLFEEHNAQLFGISIDNLGSHKAFARNLNLNFPLLADSDPTGAVTKAFGVFDEDARNAQRALFVIDEEGIIRWRQVVPKNVNPGADGILKALEEIAPTNHSQNQSR